MGKKPKDPKKTNNGGGGGGAGGGSNIFKSIFGDIPEQGTSFSSVLSDDNPFRRKPIDHSKPLSPPQQQLEQLGLDSVGADSENAGFVDEKKRKRNKEKKKPNFDLGSADEALGRPLEIKKSKRGEPESHDFDIEAKADLGFDSKELSKKGKGKKLNSEEDGVGSLEVEREDEGKRSEKKKKRKRDELEADYEAKRYGEVVAKEEGREEGKLGGKIVGEKRKTSDNPEDMLVSREGFDDEDKLLRTVFVGNLPLKVKKKVLLKEFSQFGEVDSVRIRSIPIMDNKIPRKGAIIQKKINDSADSVHAYIVFKSENSAQASLAHNMAVIGGNHVRVDRACPPRKKMKGDNVPLYDNKRTVFVGNLPFDVKDEELYQLFCSISTLESNIEAVRVIRDPNTSVGKGIAYILFKTRGAANLVVNKRNLKLRDRDLRLYHAKPSTPSKRKLPYETENSPAKKLAVGSRTPDSNNKVKSKDSLSYQGMRASKSGVQKKAPSKITEPLKPKSVTQWEKPKQRTKKRPTVAARKANALKLAGQKRKMESQTPESAQRNKKPRKFR